MLAAPLHVHSMYSALDGWSTPLEIAQRVKQIGAEGTGLTDHGNVCGHLHMAKVAAEEGIKVLLGEELYHGVGLAPKQKRDQAHLIALAVTSEGLHNLWRLSDCASHRDHVHHVGRIFWEDLEKYHEGIVFTSACALGLVPQEIVQGNYQSLDHYLDILGDQFYIEISTYPETPQKDFNVRMYNEALIAVAQERGIPMVYGDDGHYANESQYPFHDAYLARQTGQCIYTPTADRTMWHPKNAVVIKDEAMIYEHLYYVDPDLVGEMIQNAADIIHNADVQLPEVRRHLPVYVPADSPFCTDAQKHQTAEELFIDLVIEGIERKYDNPSEEVWERALMEADILVRDGIHHYFLMGWDEMKLADSLDIIRGPGRGSSGGSIVSYALGITDVDPLRYGLIFERFWNSGRAEGFPDIDSDFSRARREELIEALKERWGEDRVLPIGTTGSLKPKAVIDKMYNACGITREEADELKKIIGKTTKIDILGHDQIGWNPELEPGKKYYVNEDVGEEVEEWVLADPDREAERAYFVDICEHTCSRVSQYGIHASGLVISDVDTTEELPAQMRGGKTGQRATMFNMAEIDKREYVKLDVLGLRTLDTLQYWKESMQEHYGIDIQWSGLDQEEYPDEMWDLLSTGLTAGVFQVEDGYGRQLCKRMKPRSIDDLGVIVALNRPGPIQAGIPDRYMARRDGTEAVTYPHPVFQEMMEPYLAKNYGLLLYQENIINYFNRLGYTPSEADAIRKIMGKKKPEQMDAVRDGLKDWEGKGYLDRAVSLGMPREVAYDIWSDIEGFADYCFNLSHAIEYGVISFRTVFAKYYGPSEFYAAVIRSLDPLTDKEKRQTMLPMLVNECHRQQIPVLPPDIHHSRVNTYSHENGSIYFGLSDIAGVRNGADYIVKLREEGLDCATPETFQEALERYNEEWKEARDRIRKDGGVVLKEQSPKQKFNAAKIKSLIQSGIWSDDWSLTEKQRAEMEYLGVILTDNSAEVVERNLLQISECDTYEDALAPFIDKALTLDIDTENGSIEFQLPGIVTTVTEKIARKSKKPFGIISIGYESDELEFVVFSKDWRPFKKVFGLRDVGIFTIVQRPDNEFGQSYAFKRGTKLT